MNRIIKNIYWYGLKKVLLPYSKRYISNSLTIFNFHQVTPQYDPKLHSKGTWTSLDQFKTQIKYIQRNFQLISLEEGIKRIEKRELDKKYASITFDDGDISFQQYVYPYLIENKIYTTIFLNTAYIGTGSASWYSIIRFITNDNKLKNLIPDNISELDLQLRNTSDKEFYDIYTKQIDLLEHKIPDNINFYVDNDFLESVNPEYVNLGLHGHEHHRYSMLSIKQKEEDLNKNINALNQLNAYKPFFAIPFGKYYDWDTDTIKLLLDKNLKIFLHDGGINIKQDITLKRIPADNRRLDDVFFKNILIGN